MTHYLRYFAFIACFLLSMTSYAVDHIICQLTNQGIPAQAQADIEYTNTYTCTNTYPKLPQFPALQLVMSVVPGSIDPTMVKITGSCATQPLASGNSCQFNLSIRVTKTSILRVQISAGALYYLELPAFTVTVPNATAVITWPSFNVGSAQVNSSGTGSGIFVPDAVDSSGHKITYTFVLSNRTVGTVVGNQNGSFILQGIDVNNPGTITVIATADDAAPVPGVPIPIKVNNVPSKILAIYNNTDEVLYPIIESPILSVEDNWMQAEFQVPASQMLTRKFQQTRLHRTYPSPNGIQPGQSVIVSIPFYMQAVLNPQQPTGSQPDDYIDNFNAMRVYIYDVQANFLDNAYLPDTSHPDTLYSPGILCVSGCTGELPTYNSGPDPLVHVNAIPAADPVQLLEYTFGDSVKQPDGTYKIDITHVDYDVSAVDQVYLPIAMEPYGNDQIGYTGTVMSLSQFRPILSSFAANQPWPTYVGTPPYTYPRVPGAYNVIIGNQSLTPNQAQISLQFLAYWADCYASPSHTYHNQCLAVYNLFNQNYINYQALCSDPNPVTPLNFVQHIYGWVAFNTCPNQASISNDLAPTPGGNYSAAESAYQILQYSPPVPVTGYSQPLAFNAYVGLIHNPSLLNMNIYAFSIDDAVGNMNEIGDGVIVAVGGSNGLPNKQQFDPAKIATVIPGPPALPNTNYFSAFDVSCVGSHYNGTLVLNQSFKIQAVFPCLVTLTDNAHGLPYTFTITNSPPYPTNTNGVSSGFIKCDQSTQPTWCNAINVDKQSIPTQAPNP